jgi:Uncharacterized conserved protein related to MYG1 family
MTKILATHSGTFHADDVFAYTVLAAALGGDVGLVRTRDPAVIDAADIVFDVGGIHDPDRMRFDHHMRGHAPSRPDGTPYSSFGLVWKRFGRDFLSAIDPSLQGPALEAVWTALDQGVVLQVDRADNGVEPGVPGDLGSTVEAFNPAWDAAQDHDAAFMQAHAFAAGVLERAAGVAASRERARVIVLEAATHGADPRILELPRALPWEEAVLDGGFLDLLFAVFPDDGPDGTWLCKAVPDAKGSLGQRRSLPDAWRGLRGDDVAAATGVPDAVFCHLAGFICGAASREGAMALALAACEPAHEPRP